MVTVVDCGCVIAGDIIIKAYYEPDSQSAYLEALKETKLSKSKKVSRLAKMAPIPLFRFTFHTAFMPAALSMQFEVSDLDSASEGPLDSPMFPPGFRVCAYFSDSPPPEAPARANPLGHSGERLQPSHAPHQAQSQPQFPSNYGNGHTASPSVSYTQQQHHFSQPNNLPAQMQHNQPPSPSQGYVPFTSVHPPIPPHPNTRQQPQQPQPTSNYQPPLPARTHLVSDASASTFAPVQQQQLSIPTEYVGPQHNPTSPYTNTATVTTASTTTTTMQPPTPTKANSAPSLPSPSGGPPAYFLPKLPPPLNTSQSAPQQQQYQSQQQYQVQQQQQSYYNSFPTNYSVNTTMTTTTTTTPSLSHSQTQLQRQQQYAQQQQQYTMQQQYQQQQQPFAGGASYQWKS